MILYRKFASLLAGSILVAASAGWAQGTTPPAGSPPPAAQEKASEAKSATASAPALLEKAATLHELVGTISSITDNQLVLSRKVKDQPTDTSFILDASTKRLGTLKAGVRASVRYRMENGQNVVSVVKAMAPRKVVTRSKAAPSPK